MIDKKKCSICKELKDLNEYQKDSYSKSGFRSSCKKCTKAKESSSKRKNQKSKWRTENSGKINEYKRRYKLKNKNNPLYIIENRLRARLCKVISSKGLKMTSNSKDIIGCSWDELKQHLEEQFKDGMTWDNRSDWHIDHIIPLASADTIKELYKLNHYSNLQPLWAKDNLKKGSKIG